MTKNNTLGWLVRVPGSKRGYILALTAVQVLHGASGVFYALLLREIVDAATSRDRAGFIKYLIFFALLIGLQLTLQALIRWLSELSRATLENIFKARLNNMLLRRDYLKVSALHSGEWMNRLTSDTMVVADNAVQILPGLAGMAVKLVSAVVMIIVLEPVFAAILLPLGTLLMLFSTLFRKRMKRLHKGVRETDGRLRVFLQERIACMLMIRSFVVEDRIQAEAVERMEDHKSARMRRNRFANLCNFGFGVAMNGMYLLGVAWCCYGILTGRVSFGTLTAVTQLITQIQTPFANITAYVPRYYAMLASAERLMEAETFAQDAEEAAQPAEMVHFYQNELCKIGLKDVGFTYFPAAGAVDEIHKDDMPVVLEHLTLSIKKGEYVAFTGQSGCGKSTALKLLMCVYQPDSGERYFLSTAGSEKPLTSAFRCLFAYVPQGNVLMSGTIREIVSFADPSAAGNEKRLKEALQIACALEFVDALDSGVDTLLGERGAGLSEGQMQRLSIARAVFSGRPILLLDEVTSALDAETERQLLNNLRRMTDRTVIIVTHRPAALEVCDRVLQFTENGVIEHES